MLTAERSNEKLKQIHVTGLKPPEKRLWPSHVLLGLIGCICGTIILNES